MLPLTIGIGCQKDKIQPEITTSKLSNDVNNRSVDSKAPVFIANKISSLNEVARELHMPSFEKKWGRVAFEYQIKYSESKESDATMNIYPIIQDQDIKHFLLETINTQKKEVYSFFVEYSGFLKSCIF